MKPSIPPPTIFDGQQVPAVYGIFQVSTGRVYIGSAVNLRNRWYRHRWELRLGKHTNQILQRAWNKYGADDFEFRMIEVVTAETLAGREQYWMDFYKCCDRKHGFNILPNARSLSGYKYTPEQRAKCIPWNKGKKMSADFCEKVRQGNARKPPVTQEFRDKMSLICAGRKHTEETKARMSADQKARCAGRLMPQSKFTVEQILEIKGLLARGQTQSSIARQFGVPSVYIHDIAHKKRYAWIIAAPEIEQAIKKGLGNHKGSRVHNSILTESQVREIKRLLLQGGRPVDIAKIYGVGRYIVSHIKHGKAWSHVIPNVSE